MSRREFVLALVDKNTGLPPQRRDDSTDTVRRQLSATLAYDGENEAITALWWGQKKELAEVRCQRQQLLHRLHHQAGRFQLPRSAVRQSRRASKGQFSPRNPALNPSLALRATVFQRPVKLFNGLPGRGLLSSAAANADGAEDDILKVADTFAVGQQTCPDLKVQNTLELPGNDAWIDFDQAGNLMEVAKHVV